MDLIGRTLPPALACRECEAEIDPRGGIYVEPNGDGLQPVCSEHAESATGVEVERRSRPESEEKWDEWYVITSVPDAG